MPETKRAPKHFQSAKDGWTIFCPECEGEVILPWSGEKMDEGDTITCPDCKATLRLVDIDGDFDLQQMYFKMEVVK